MSIKLQWPDDGLFLIDQPDYKTTIEVINRGGDGTYSGNVCVVTGAAFNEGLENANGTPVSIYIVDGNGRRIFGEMDMMLVLNKDVNNTMSVRFNALDRNTKDKVVRNILERGDWSLVTPDIVEVSDDEIIVFLEVLEKFMYSSGEMSTERGHSMISGMMLALKRKK